LLYLVCFPFFFSNFNFVTAVLDSWAGWSVLVMDDDATRVISSAIGMYDIMERKVMLVEDLFKKRAPFPDRAAIYLLAPSEKSVDKMLEDFAGDKPLYGQAAFIFFLGRCSDRLVNKIKECRPLLKVLKKFAEVNVDFLAKEIRAFHLDMRSSFKSIYGSKRSKVENAIADKLLTVCATLNEYPHIRFPEESRFCQSLAKAFHSRMDTFLRNNADFWYHGDSQHTDRDRATLLLLDRKDDCLSPLIHEFTYQALVNDLLPIDNDLITIDMEASTKDNSAKTVKQDVLLNENDSLWVELRSKHIADVGQILSNRIREMINSDTSQVTHREKGTMTVAEMSKALQALPEYREVMSKLSEHLRLSQMCWEKLKERELVDLSQLEQTLATGKDEDGRSPKLAEMIDRVVEELHTLKDTVLKMRLIMILIVSQGGIKSEFKEKVWRAANLKSSAERVIMKLEIMGIPIVTSDQSVRGFKKLFG
jgi:syntaxin-binding protein 1